MSNNKSARQVLAGVGVAAGALLAAAMIPLATAPQASADDATDVADPALVLGGFGDYGGDVAALISDEEAKVFDIVNTITAVPADLFDNTQISIEEAISAASVLDLSEAATALLGVPLGALNILIGAGETVLDDGVQIPLEPADFVFGLIP